ncbi:MAG: LPS export ABC transporter periplasmic protein LptC [Pseudomonadota bacterium]
MELKGDFFRNSRKLFDRRTLAILSVLLALAALSQWLRTLDDFAPPAVRISHDPDYTMEDFTVTAMGVTGKPEHRLQAAYMAHYPDDMTTEFTQPHITVYRSDGSAPWHIHAERGWMAADHKFILLRGDVLIENPDAPPLRVVRLTTRELRVLADEEYAETDQPVTIRSKTGVTKGVGMKAYLKDGRLQLLSQVRGSYAPRAKPNKKR